MWRTILIDVDAENNSCEGDYIDENKIQTNIGVLEVIQSNFGVLV